MVGCQTTDGLNAAAVLPAGKNLTFISGRRGVGQTLLVQNLAVCLRASGLRARAVSDRGSACNARRTREFGADEEGDILLVDAPPGATPRSTTLAAQADHVVFVTTTAPYAMADAYAAMKLIVARGVLAELGIVASITRTAAEARRCVERLGAAASRFLGRSLTPLGHLPWDRHVGLAYRNRVPLVSAYPACAASLCLQQISEQIGVWIGRPRSGGGFWSRIESVFL